MRFKKKSKFISSDTSFVKIMLAKDINYDTLLPLEFLTSKCLNSDCVTLDLQTLAPGDYVCLVEIDWNKSGQQKYVFQAYSDSNKIDLNYKPGAQASTTFDYLAEMLKSCAKTRSQKKYYTEKGHSELFRCMSITDSQAEYGYIYYQNDSKTACTLRESVIFNKLENFSIVLEDQDKSTRIERHVPKGVIPFKDVVNDSKINTGIANRGP
jgi:hypothetical protein